MTLISHHDEAYGGHHDGFLLTAARWVDDRRRAWAHRRSMYRTVRALETVSDRTLHDIGIDRSAILSEARAAADREFGIANPDDRAF